MNQVARRKEKCKTTQTWGTMMSFFSFIRQRKSHQTETNLFFWMSWKQAEGKNKLAIEFGHSGKTRVKSFQTILTVQMKITPEWFYCKAKEAVDIGVLDGINVRGCETLSVVRWLCELEAFDLWPGFVRMQMRGVAGEGGSCAGLQVVALPPQLPAPDLGQLPPTYLQ